MKQTPEVEAVRPFRLNFQKLRAHRRAREVSQQQLADLVGIGLFTYHRTEWGQRDHIVSVREAIAYSRALGVPFTDLFEVIDE